LQAQGAGTVARLAAAAGVGKLVQMSAIGADPASPSRYASSKARGEALVREHFPRASILRPSLVFGAEDQFFNRFASLATMSPIMPVIAGASRFQPVYVGDVADAVMAVLTRPGAHGLVYELAAIPFSGLTADQLLMLQRDNVADPALPGLADLGITPTPIELVVPDYLARYRKGGRRTNDMEIVSNRP
jgi:NADH dehydrogenase